jgi:hypothetical protein
VQYQYKNFGGVWEQGLKNILLPTREAVTWAWKIFSQYFYFSLNICVIGVIQWMRIACGTHGGEKKYIQGLGWKLKGKGLHERPRRRWAYNANMNIKETGWEGVDNTHRFNTGRSGGWALLNEAKDIRAPQNAVNCFKNTGSISFSLKLCCMDFQHHGTTLRSQ